MKHEHSTSDFLEAILLWLLKHALVSINRDNPRRALFVFERTPKLEEDLQTIRRGQLKVDPVDFWNAQKRLKRILYDATEGVWK